MMAHGVEAMSDHANSLKMVQSVHHQTLNHQQAMQQPVSQSGRKNVGVMGSRRIFAATFKLKVLDSYRNDIDCRGNQRATARKYGIHRRQIQKWLQCEENLRSSCAESNATTTVTSSGCCAVPIGVGSVLSTSPGPNTCQLDVMTKTEVTSVTLSSTSSSSSSSSSSLVNSNSNSPGVNCNVSSGSPGTSHGAPAATVAPALNLSLARLHGDELAARHSPPHHPTGGGAPMRHSIRRCSSPTSLQYLQHNSNNNTNNNNNNINTINNNQVPSSCSTAPLRGMHVCYEKYASQQDTVSQNHQRHQRRQHQSIEVHDSQNPSRSPERKYFYGINRPSNFEQHDAILSRTTNADGYYETLETYRKSNAFVDFGNVNNNNNNVKEVGKVEPVSYCPKNSMEEAGSGVRAQLTQNAKAPSYAPASSLLVLHATAIKSERASPDSLATTAPCETPGSPESASLMPRHSRHHHNNNNNDNNQRTNQLPCRLAIPSSETCNNGNHVDVCSRTSARNNNLANVTSSVANTTMGATAAIATAPTVAVHSNETTTSPLVEHVHVSLDSHAFVTRDSEKRPQGRERQQHQQYRHGDTTKVEYEEGMSGGRRVKEEIVERDEVKTASTPETPRMMMMMMMTTTTGQTKREIPEEIDDSTYHRDSTITDYQEITRITTDSSSGDSSGHTSPIVRESVGSYSVLSSPRAASSSGISTSSSCSDSEIDPLDYSSGTARNVITDLSRRRSFSLRFKLDVLDAFHSDIAVAGNQRATARKFGINRRQVQKWLGQENDLRGEIALRGGDLRQRLGPMPEISGESTLAVDLRTSSMTTATISGRRSETELDDSSPPLYCCDVGSSSRRNVYYRNSSLAESPEIPSSCTLACCADSYVGSSMICYQDSMSQRRSSSGYPESQGSLYCYSPRDPLDNEVIDVAMSSSPLKRSACNLTCCYEMLPSPKRFCMDNVDEPRDNLVGQEQPPQDVPLCLVKPKGSYDPSPMHTEPVTSTVPTPPVAAPLAPTPATKKDAILFKPYLDNPISKPTEDIQLSHHHPNHRGLSPLSAQSVIVNNNNNCHAICNLNEERTVISQHDYALELSLRVPVSWRTQHSSYGEFPERLGSAFVRYPTSPHYT